jgi:hypothetical protein
LVEHPFDLKKRVNLFKHFWTSLVPSKEDREVTDESFKSNVMIHIKKWAKVKDAYIFWLSNKSVQIAFEDKVNVVMDTGKHEVILEDSEGQILTSPLALVMESGNEKLISWVKKSRELLNLMIPKTNSTS